MTNAPTLQSYLMMTLDPLHVGTGSDQIGHVDLPIVREPGTNLPKVPGTTMSGSLRAYAARLTDSACAGKDGQGGKGHCGTCSVCYTFGFLKGKGGQAGTATMFDALLTLFPVYSSAGAVWLTTLDRLDAAGFRFATSVAEASLPVTTIPDRAGKRLNLGSRLVELAPSALVPAWRDGNTPPREWDVVARRLVVVGEEEFPVLVNANLEVRTSVSIDPLTGAADDGALFSYEALPRATWLSVDVGIDDYRVGESTSPFAKQDQKGPLDLIHGALLLAETLGMGGMGTRGFGRVRTFISHPIDRTVTSAGIA